jgi:hypothetical protein
VPPLAAAAVPRACCYACTGEHALGVVQLHARGREHIARTHVLTRLYAALWGPCLVVQGTWFCVRWVLTRSGALHAFGQG